MSNSNHPEKPRRLSLGDWLPGWVFAFGMVIVPVAFVIGCLSSHPSGDWGTSFFGHSLAWPFFVVGFCCSCLSPLFTRSARWLRFVLSLSGAAVFVLVFSIS